MDCTGQIEGKREKISVHLINIAANVRDRAEKLQGVVGETLVSVSMPESGELHKGINGTGTYLGPGTAPVEETWPPLFNEIRVLLRATDRCLAAIEASIRKAEI